VRHSHGDSTEAVALLAPSRVEYQRKNADERTIVKRIDLHAKEVDSAVGRHLPQSLEDDRPECRPRVQIIGTGELHLTHTMGSIGARKEQPPITMTHYR
jgi:hypothetical protein